MSNFQVNGKTIAINKRNFISQGGEGSVYAKGKKAFKIYTDSSDMIPAGKIRELSALTNSNIIKPEEVIYKNGQAVGYTMRYIKDNVALCKVFTKAFKGRNNITPEISFSLVKDMQNTVSHIHDNNILIVDLNEMNFLTSKDFKDVYFIDVDSYQTPSHKATALMESVRDRHCEIGSFNKDSDWFSFAVVTFQILIGIHPYKGKHPSLKGFDERMTNNVSVFSKDVSMPKCCLPFDVIPANWRDWYRAVFENGVRCEPPKVDELITQIATVVAKVTGSNNFEIKELFECDWGIVNYQANFGNDCTICNKGFRTKSGKNVKCSMPYVIGYYGSTPYAIKIKDGLIKVHNINMQQNVTINDIKVDDLMSTGGRVYAKQDDKILELGFMGIETIPVVVANVVGAVMENSTQLFSGVAIQNMLGSFVASVFPESGKCIQHNLKGLDGYQIINAKYENKILMIVGVKGGKYNRFIYSLEDYTLLGSRVEEDIQNTEINFTVLDNGVCITITDTEEVQIFSNKNINKIKEVQDNIVHGGMRLFHDGNTGMFADGKKMFTIKMKSS